MEQTWRWFGPDDPVTLANIRQAGATGVVTALHHLNDGRAWPQDEVDKRRAMIEDAGLTWNVTESIVVHEDIKTRTHRYLELIENYKASIRAVAKAGIDTICYNFMAITDWTRTDLEYPMPHGGTALRFDIVELCIYDLLMLKRPGAETDHPADRIKAAHERTGKMSESDLARIERNMIEWVPAREFVYDRKSFQRMLDIYQDITPSGMADHLVLFLREIVPVAEEHGVRLAIHPDDPPFSIFGLPRVVSNRADLQRVVDAVPSPSNGLTFCAGSLGASLVNDLPKMAKALAPHIHFVHLRNVTREADGSFYEAEHLGGDHDMVEIISNLREEESRREREGCAGSVIPMRPDHGHAIFNDLNSEINPGYSGIGRMKGLAELRGIMHALDRIDQL